MTASSSSEKTLSVPDAGKEPPIVRSSLVEAARVDSIGASDSGRKLQSDEADSSSKTEQMSPPEDLKMTPKASHKRIDPGSDDASTPSPSSDPTSGLESANGSPQSSNRTVVSHVPSSVQQPVLHPDEQSSRHASPIPPRNVQPVVQSDVPQLVQQPKPVVPVAPILKIAPGTAGQVVTKKGRFRLLQNAPIIEDGSEISSTAAAAVVDVPPTATGGSAAAATAMPAPTEGGAIPPVSTLPHPSRERSLSNTSTLSAVSAPGPGQPNPVMMPQSAAPSSTNSLSSEPIVNPPVIGAPAVKKKGRFVVIPGNVTDPAMIARGPIDGALTRQITPTGQPFPGQQGATRQPVHGSVAGPAHPMDQASGGVTQQAQGILQPVMTLDSGQQVYMAHGNEPQQYFVPVQVPQHTLAGNLQHHLQQVNPPLYYYAAPYPQSGAPQVVQLSYPQHQQPAGPAAAQSRSSHSPVPASVRSGYPTTQQIPMQPPTHVLVSDSVPPPPQQHVQMEETRSQDMVAGPQQMPTVGDSDAALQAGQQIPTHAEAPLPQQTHSHSGAPMPPSGEALKAQPLKGAKLKRPTGQRSASFATKGAPANVGFGKVFYFLDQMKLEVTEADRTIKHQQKDMKFLRDKNKELEAKSRDMEKRWLEEKNAREALEAKVRSLRKKVKELKGSMAANNVDKIKEVDDKLTEVAELTKPQPQSRSDSLEDEQTAAPSPVEAAHKMATNTEQPAVTQSQTSVTESGSSASLPPVSKSAFQQQQQISENALSDSADVAGSNTNLRRKGNEAIVITDQPETHGALPIARENDSTTHSNGLVATKLTAAASLSETDAGGMTRSSSGENLDGLKYASSSASSKLSASTESVSGPSARLETAGAPSENISPSRRQHPIDKGGDRREMEKIPSSKALAKEASSQALETIGDPSSRYPERGGLMNREKVRARSSGSLGSTGQLNPLQGDGSIGTQSAPIAPGQAPLPPAVPTGSLVTFVTSPAVVQQIDFDPLRVSYDRGNRDDQMGPATQDGGVIQGHQPASTEASISSMEMPGHGSLQYTPHHSQSQSMPNFILQNGMIATMGNMVGTQQPMVACPVQQMDPMQMARNANVSHQMQQQSWNQYQQSVMPGQQNQYIPMQYSAPSPASTNQQQQQQQFLSDPFDELASRRAPGTTGLQQQQQQQQKPSNNWTNQPT